MELLTVILSAVAAVASVLSVVLVVKSDRDNKRHLLHRLQALDEEYFGPLSCFRDPSGRDKVRAEMNTIKKDLNIK